MKLYVITAFKLCFNFNLRPYTLAMFGFGGGKKAAAANTPYICIDCGFIYRGDFAALPKDYKCPQCNVGKNRFKPYKVGRCRLTRLVSTLEPQI